MKSSRIINVIDAHTCGEPIRVVVGGIPYIPGETVKERLSYFQNNMEDLRTFLICEPRGHANMYGAILTAPISPGSAFSEFFLSPGGYPTLCGHGTIGVATVAAQIGIVALQGDNTIFNIDTAVGTIGAKVSREGEKITGVTIKMVPSFFLKEQFKFEVPGIGSIEVDIVYGGNYFYAEVDSRKINLELVPGNAQKIIDMGLKIRKILNKLTDFRHPEQQWIKGISAVDFYCPSDHPDITFRVVHVYGTGQIDRSPCGSGTAARMSLLYAKGKLKMGEVYIQESILGTIFKGRVIEETKIAGHPAVLTEISGSAFITGINQLLLDDEDPLGKGFLL